MNIYVWHGPKDFYSTGLYVASGHTVEEAARKIAKQERHGSWEEKLKNIQYLENRIKELEAGSKSNWSPGVEVKNVKLDLERLQKVIIEDIENQNDQNEKWMFDKLMSFQPEVVQLEDLAVYEKEVG